MVTPPGIWRPLIGVAAAPPALPAPPGAPAAPVAGPQPPASDSAPGPAGPRLAWAPPALDAPTTITVAQGDQWYTLDPGKDYILNLPSTVHRGQVGFTGGHDVVLMG